MRQQIASLPFELQAENIPLADKNGVISLKPMVRFPHLPELVHHFIEQHQEADSLCGHPEKSHDEVWVKIGGDHGGGSFKLSFQLGNVANPNSVKNTVPFLGFARKDTPGILATFQPYADQITSLKCQHWQRKQIKVIFLGDYEFLCACYVLSGPSGVRPCLYCLAKKTAFPDALSKDAFPDALTLIWYS